MAKLKTFEEYIASMDSAEEIEKDIVAMGEPEEAEGGEEVISDDQPEAEAPKKSEDEGAGEEAEEMESDAEEVHSEEDKETEEGDQEMPEDEGEEGAVEVAEAEEKEEDDEVETQIADDEEEGGDDAEAEGDKSEEDAEDTDGEDEDEDEDEESEEAEAKATVEEMVKELYERVKEEAKVWEEDAHDTHTIESYLKENCALHASMATEALKSCKEDITQEQYESACNGLKEAYSKKIDEMMEAWNAEGETI
jgi:hypothetical protein